MQSQETLASPGWVAGTSSHGSSAHVVNADDEDESSEDEHAVGLPRAALELLSEMLTGLVEESSVMSVSGAAISAPRSGVADEAYTTYRPVAFCVNCCRPLATKDEGCRGCGHHPSRDAEVLGDPHAWAQAYAQQVAAQQLHQQQQQQQQLQQGGGAAPAAGATWGGGRSVLLASDPEMLLHRSSLPPCPARPERLQAIMARLHSRGLLPRCRLLPCRPATDAELLAVHSPALVDAVHHMGAAALHMGAVVHEDGGAVQGGAAAAAGAAGNPEAAAAAVPAADAGVHFAAVLAAVAAADAAAGGGGGDGGGDAASVPHAPETLSPDTLYNAHTGTSALLAAGAAADVGKALATGAARGALAVVRPPGAQASRDTARGGCFFNNVAVAAAAALAGGAKRVLIVDWDVHHGGGTQDIFYSDPRVLTLSMHRYATDTYPGSGAVEEVGEGAGEGFSLNVAFASGGLQDGDLLSAALHVVLPVAAQFRPDVVLVAAGFGALGGDSVGGCFCSPAVFSQLTHLLWGVAPLGLFLEGGYALESTAEAAEACLRVLLGEAPAPLPGSWATSQHGWVGIMNAMQIHSHFWSCLRPLSFNGWAEAIGDQQQQQQLQEAGEGDEEEEEAEEEQHHANAASSAHAPELGGGWSVAAGDALGLEDEGKEEGGAGHLGWGVGVGQRTRAAAGVAGEGAEAREDIDAAEMLDALFGLGDSEGGSEADGGAAGGARAGDGGYDDWDGVGEAGAGPSAGSGARAAAGAQP